MSVVEVHWEVDVPKGIEPLHWVLLTSERLNGFSQAWTIIDWYEKRQLIEEYHKCLKTGCRIEHRQYKTSTRLQRMTGLLSVVAVRLLQRLSGNGTITTVGEFFRTLAGLGGFPLRSHTRWRGRLDHPLARYGETHPLPAWPSSNEAKMWVTTSLISTGTTRGIWRTFGS
ncbi:MAG: hypothetical protein R3B91_08280 [Planctomycetaceae bacterium]